MNLQKLKIPFILAIFILLVTTFVIIAQLGYHTPSKEQFTSFSFVGDIMMHDWQITKCYDAKTDTFDTSACFDYIRPILTKSDFTVGNLETTLAGRGKGAKCNTLGYSGFPYFNAPEGLATDLKEAGFDLLQTANNHCLDSGMDGLFHTLSVLDQAGLAHTGTYLSAELKKPCILTINQLRIGFISYTYDLNGPAAGKLPENINTLQGQENFEPLLDEVREMEHLDVDFICVLMHYGDEYEATPNAMQQTLALELTKQGADLIIGTHSHVVQPMEHIKTMDDNGQLRESLVFYSLGDFLAGNAYEEGIDKDLGMIVTVYFSQNKKAVKSQTITSCIDHIEILPTYLVWTKDIIAPISVYDALQHPKAYPFLTEHDMERLHYAKELFLNYDNCVSIQK